MHNYGSLSHRQIYINIIPFIYVRLETAASGYGLRQVEASHHDVHVSRVWSRSYLISDIVGMVPFCAICQVYVDSEHMAVSSGAALAESQKLAIE